MSTGAYFGKSALQIGTELEDKEYERWKEWATKEIALAEQRQAAMYTGGMESGEMAVDSNSTGFEAAMEVSDQIPA